MTSLSSRRLVHVLRRNCQNRSNNNSSPLIEADSHLKWSGHRRLTTSSTTQERCRHVNNDEGFLPLWGVVLSAALLSSGAFVYSTTTNSSSCQSAAAATTTTTTGDGINGAFLLGEIKPGEGAVEIKNFKNRKGTAGNPNRRKKTSLNARKKSAYDVSVRAIQGGRIYMEDEYIVGNGGRFFGVFDGHGGGGVSNFLATNLLKEIQQQKKRKQWEEQDKTTDDYKISLSSLVSAIRSAFETVESEILAVKEFAYQGSTAVTVTIHEEERDGSRTILSANVGDSRAVLCRNGKAVDLTRDHKPNDEREKARILAMGEKIEWDNFGKVYRVRNLSLSRAIGDSFAKPAVSPEVEIKMFRINKEEDEFMVLASDGLWDVMESQEVVNFIKKKTDTLMAGSRDDVAIRIRNVRRKNMSRYVANEALKRGSGDNICVVIVWLKPLEVQ